MENPPDAEYETEHSRGETRETMHDSIEEVEDDKSVQSSGLAARQDTLTAPTRREGSEAAATESDGDD